MSLNPTDRLIRALYAMAQEEEWSGYRAIALAQVCRQMGFQVGAWLTHVIERPGRGEFTVYPEKAPVQFARLLSLPFGSAEEIKLNGDQALPGTRQGMAINYGHYDSRLTSIVAFGYDGNAKAPPAEAIHRASIHMIEAAGLAMRQFIQRDQRLFRMGRTSRGAAAVVDAGGTIYAASAEFRELMNEEFGEQNSGGLPFELPEEAFGETGSFTQGTLRFRASRLTDNHYQLYARRSLPLDELSPREQEIARALGAGKTFKTVARQCGIAVSTVANHASRIYRKLGVYRREDLVELIRTPGRKLPR